MPDIETFDYTGRQSVIVDAKKIKFSSHYGDGGSGFGYLKFILERPVGTRYMDIGFGYEVKVRKGLKVIFHGMMREISESTKNDVGTISVSAIGYTITAEDAPEILRNFCNTDLSKWIVPSQVPGGLWRPDNFATSSSSNGLVLNATSQPVDANAYTELEFEFFQDEVAKRLKCDIFTGLGKGVTFDADSDYGVIFDADVLSIDGGNDYIFYKNHSNDSVISVGMELYNVTKDISRTVNAVDTTLDRLTLSIGVWSFDADDEIYIREPLFSSTISSIASQVITYGTEVGEQNISTSGLLINSTQSETATIDSFDIAASTITAAGDISGWGSTDAISIEIVSTSSSNYLFYRDNSDETKIAAGMTVFNITQGLSAVVNGIDTSLNRLAVASPQSSWVVGDEMYVAGPLFTAVVSTVVASVITYTAEVGEGNVSTSYQLVNLTKKDSSGISSNDTGANTITASGDVSAWSQNDTIIIAAPLFQATVDSVSSTQITYSGEAGRRIVQNDPGWVLHNIDKDELATVDSWTAPNKLDVTVAGEISTWATDTIYIYTPYSVDLRDSNDVVLWPSDWRTGAVSGSQTGINVTTTASPTSFRVVFKSYIAGSGDESSFSRVSNVKAYSTIDDVTLETIAKSVLADLATLGIDSSEDEIALITKVIEPSVFEFKDIKEVLAETAKFGSQNGNRVGWGLRPTDEKLMFIEEYPTDVKYIVAKSAGESDVQVSADMRDSFQRIRGVYTDALGNKIIMPWKESTDKYFGSYYISKTQTLSNIDNDTDAQAYLQLMLDEQDAPPISSSYVTKGNVITDQFGNTIPFDEVVADGTFIEVEDFRASVTGEQSSDLSANWVRDRLVAVEIDIDSESVKLIPGKARKTFEVYMAELSRIAKL